MDCFENLFNNNELKEISTLKLDQCYYCSTNDFYCKKANSCVNNKNYEKCRMNKNL